MGCRVNSDDYLELDDDVDMDGDVAVDINGEVSVYLDRAARLKLIEHLVKLTPGA